MEKIERIKTREHVSIMDLIMIRMAYNQIPDSDKNTVVFGRTWPNKTGLNSIRKWAMVERPTRRMVKRQMRRLRIGGNINIKRFNRKLIKVNPNG